MFKGAASRALGVFALFTVVCGLGYTLVVTGIAQVAFPYRANGSLIKVDGKVVGSELIGQNFEDEDHMWGRIQNVTIVEGEDGELMAYGAPSNLSPASEEYQELVDARVEKIRAANRPVKVLNLFGYTGGATLACAAAGATVCHVDASKGIVAWGKDNAVASGLTDKPIRWLVDDCAKFVAREKRRGNTYDGIIMDPPSYGRGPGGEIWKLEDGIYDLISQCEEVLSDTPLFFAVNSYTTGLSPAVMEYMLKTTLVPRFGGKTSCDEIGLPVSATGGVVPCGATAIWEE